MAINKTKNVTTVTADPGKQEVTITREFDAPRELVFKAHVDPKLYVQWLGPKGYKMRLDEFEPRSGGSWRYVHTDEQGNEFGFRGIYHEVLAPERLIDTFEFESLPEKGHVSLETARFEDLPGNRTRLTVQAVFQSVADRDAMISGGMERGVRESHERLDDLLLKQQ
jgi:uncharacterized protein YndB with AHSA1/START domain